MKSTHFYLLSILIILGLTNCTTKQNTIITEQDTVTAKQSESKETQVEKFWRLYEVDSNKLVIGSDNRITIESLEEVFKPIKITKSSEAASILNESEPGEPRYFKLTALYKGFIKEPNSSIFLQTNIEKNVFNTVHNWIIGYFQVVEATFPSQVNCNATFYIVAGRFTEPKDEIGVWVRAVRNIEEPLYNPTNFILANDRRFITLNDVHLPSANNNGIYAESIFDPTIYPLFNLFDARIAMDKKKWGDNNTYPETPVKYASEVIFKGQNGTNIFFSTEDNFITEVMTFYGRVGSINKGDKIRIYYTIQKYPGETWEVQALEILK